MITKTQLREDKDGQNRVKYQFDMPWDETTLSRLYDKIEREIEGGALIDIISAVPISLDLANNTIKVEVTLGLDDLFSQENLDKSDFLG